MRRASCVCVCVITEAMRVNALGPTSRATSSGLQEWQAHTTSVRGSASGSGTMQRQGRRGRGSEGRAQGRSGSQSSALEKGERKRDTPGTRAVSAAWRADGQQCNTSQASPGTMSSMERHRQASGWRAAHRRHAWKGHQGKGRGAAAQRSDATAGLYRQCSMELGRQLRVVRRLGHFGLMHQDTPSTGDCKLAATKRGRGGRGRSHRHANTREGAHADATVAGSEEWMSGRDLTEPRRGDAIQGLKVGKQGPESTAGTANG